MSQTENGQANSHGIRADFVARLRLRCSEIEEIIFARVLDSLPSDHAGSGDTKYLARLRATVTAVLDYGLMGIEQGGEWSGPIPSLAVAQARRAARNGVGLETVLLCYAAGSRLLSGFVMAEAAHSPSQVLHQVLDMQGSLLERLITTISIEYKFEVERAGRSFDQRRGEYVQRLLSGEPIDLADFDYEFDGWHLGMIFIGSRAQEAVRELEAACGRQLLSVARGEKTVWAWLGRKGSLETADIEPPLLKQGTADVSIAIGEPGRGIQGWRLTHHQAQAALLVTQRRPQRVTRYAEDMLLAAALRDGTLVGSLEAIYLSPLANQRDGGQVSRETLRRYFDARSNAATAAVTLGVDRHTVERRLRVIEKRLGRLLHTCQPELEVALRLHELGSAADIDTVP